MENELVCWNQSLLNEKYLPVSFNSQAKNRRIAPTWMNENFNGHNFTVFFFSILSTQSMSVFLYVSGAPAWPILRFAYQVISVSRQRRLQPAMALRWSIRRKVRLSGGLGFAAADKIKEDKMPYFAVTAQPQSLWGWNNEWVKMNANSEYSPACFRMNVFLHINFSYYL